MMPRNFYTESNYVVQIPIFETFNIFILGGIGG